MNIYKTLQKINGKPTPFQFYTTPDLWNDKYISKKMLEFHLKDDIDLASRNKVFINKSVRWLISKFNINHSTHICDFGCGPGLYTTEFAKTGAYVTGIDLSKASIDYAKDIASSMSLNINYILQNYLTFISNEKFDLITMIFCDFCVLSPKQCETLLKKFYGFLKPNGYLVFDVFSFDFFKSSEEMHLYEYVERNGFWSPNPYYVFQNNFKYEKEQLLLQKYTIFEESALKESYNWLQCYSIETVKQLLQNNGLTVTEYYSHVTGDEYDRGSKEIAIVAKKQ